MTVTAAPCLPFLLFSFCAQAPSFLSYFTSLCRCLQRQHEENFAQANSPM